MDTIPNRGVCLIRSGGPNSVLVSSLQAQLTLSWQNSWLIFPLLQVFSCCCLCFWFFASNPHISSYRFCYFLFWTLRVPLWTDSIIHDLTYFSSPAHCFELSFLISFNWNQKLNLMDLIIFVVITHYHIYSRMT